MKRVGYLWKHFCSEQNAITAIYRGTENKRGDRVVRRLFGYDDSSAAPPGSLDPEKVGAYARRLVARLESDRWTHKAGKQKTILSGGKVRDIEIAVLEDHFVQWMAILTIEDYLMKRMYRYSVGNLPKRGIEYARKTVERWVRSGDCKYFVKLDIRHFYQNIECDKLYAMMCRFIKDERFLSIVKELVYASADDNGTGVMRGTAIGYYSSPWFANIYLTPLDRFVTEQLYKMRRGKRVYYVKHYLRNVDDQLYFGTSKSDLKKAVHAVIAYCRDELGIEIKPCWEICKIGELLPADERGKKKLKPGTTKVDIVGYTFTTTTTTVRDTNFLRTKRLAKRMAKQLDQHGVVHLRNARALVSRCGWFDHADSKEFYKKYIYPIIDIDFIKEVISYADKNKLGGKTARIYCCPRGDGSGYRILYGCTGRTA